MSAPVVNTRRLFSALLRELDVDAICDIGSMDGSDALRFRAAAPRARIVAFEANPHNVERMRTNPALVVGRIEVEPLAVSDRDGDADFFLVAADAAERARRGMSSLHRRTAAGELDPVRVAGTRLDTWLARRWPDARRLALWIDAEGKSFEIIAGAHGVLSRVDLAHVEVETVPLIAANQKTYADVRRAFDAAGFDEIATDFPTTGRQFNALFMRRARDPGVDAALQRQLRLAIHRRRVTNVVYHLLPGGVRGWLAGRYGIRGSIG